MKFCLRSSLILSVALLAPVLLFPQTSLATLYREKQFFLLRDELAERTSEHSPSHTFYRGVIANRFNKLRESNELIRAYLMTNDLSHQREAHETLADNYVRMYEYGKAADEYALLIEQFGKTVDRKQLDDYLNSEGMFGALRSTQRQELKSDGELRLHGTRDAVGMLNLPVEINGRQEDFVFDTGAELSVVTESTAKKVGLKIIDMKYSVSTSTDISIESKLAVASAMKLGNAIVKNVVFLVLEDKALYFPPVKYQIKGIVGFPVMEAFGSVTISRDDEVTAGNRLSSNDSRSNMFLEGLKPVVEAEVFGKTMGFTFDTGGVTSTFYPKFLKANRTYIVRHSKLQRRKAGGAGGMKSVMAYMLKNLEMTISGQTIKLRVAEIYPKPLNEESRIFYGNLGQDVIKQFATMTLDFQSMKLIFR